MSVPHLCQVKSALAFCVTSVDVRSNMHEGVDDVSRGRRLRGGEGGMQRRLTSSIGLMQSHDPVRRLACFAEVRPTSLGDVVYSIVASVIDVCPASSVPAQGPDDRLTRGLHRHLQSCLSTLHHREHHYSCTMACRNRDVRSLAYSRQRREIECAGL